MIICITEEVEIRNSRAITVLATDMVIKEVSAPVSSQVLQIDGISYTVVSHYAGDKDINKVVRSIAFNKAYEDMKIHSA